MKIRVRKNKEDKGEFRGLLLSFLRVFGGGSSVWGRFPWLFKQDRSEKSGNTEKSHYKSLHTVLCH